MSTPPSTPQPTPPTCPICLDALPEAPFTSPLCQHKICPPCMLRHLHHTARAGTPFPLPCPVCRIALPPHLCLALSATHPPTHTLLETFKITQHHPHRIRHCANPRCATPFDWLDDPLTRALPDAAKLVCPLCATATCALCRHVWHPANPSCAAGAAERDDTAAFRRLAADNHWKACPNCGQVVEKLGGCRSVTCRCGHGFCYRCGGHDLAHTAVARLAAAAAAAAARADSDSTPCTCFNSGVAALENGWPEARLAPRPPPAVGGPVVVAQQPERQSDAQQEEPRVGDDLARKFVVELRVRDTLRGLGYEVRVEDVPLVHLTALQKELARYVDCEFRASDLRVGRNGFIDVASWLDGAREPPLSHLTTQDLRSYICPYCRLALDDAGALGGHLVNTEIHAVFLCCGRLYDTPQDLAIHRGDHGDWIQTMQ